MPSMALQMTTSILVGNSLGQGKPEQARALGLRMAMVGALAMTVMAAVLWPFRQEMAEILSQEVETQAQIVSYLSYNLAGTPFSIASQIMGGIMVGAGATQYNLVIYGGTFWAVRLPLGWLLGHKLWGHRQRHLRRNDYLADYPGHNHALRGQVLQLDALWPRRWQRTEPS